MRQTDLSFERLLAALDSSEGQRCLLLNEIGSILKYGEKKVKEAESFLRGLLDSEDLVDRFYAFCYLSTTKNMDKDTLLKLEKFKKDPSNQTVLKRAEQAVKHPRVGH